MTGADCTWMRRVCVWVTITPATIVVLRVGVVTTCTVGGGVTATFTVTYTPAKSPKKFWLNVRAPSPPPSPAWASGFCRFARGFCAFGSVPGGVMPGGVAIPGGVPGGVGRGGVPGWMLGG